MRRFLIIIAVSLCIIALIPVAFLAAMQTRAARDLAERKLNEALTSEGRRVEIASPRIDWDGTLYAASLSVSDNEGTWLKADGIRATWTPLALLGGRISIGSVSVENIEVPRQPSSLGEAASDQAGDNANADGAAGGVPIDVDIPHIRLDRIALGAPLVGAPVEMTAQASVRLRASPAIIEVATHVERIDEVSGRFDASIGYVQDNPFLRIDMRANEPAGGLIARLLRIEALPSVRASISGEGRPDSWYGRLSVALNRQQTVKGRLNLTRVDAKRELALSLDGALADILPPSMRDVFAGALHVKGTADLADDFTPLGGQFEMTSEALEIKADGDYDVESGALSAKVDGGLLRPATWGLNEDALSADELRLTATGSGLISNLKWTFAVQGSDLSTPQGRVARLSISGKGLDADLRKESLNVPIALKADGDLATVSEPALKPLVGPFTLASTARLRADNALDLQDIDLTTQAGRARLAGVYETEEARLTGDLTMGDLSVLSELAGRALGGTLAAHLNVEGNPAAQSGIAKLDVTGENLEAGDPRLQALLGTSTTLATTIERDESGVLTLSDTTLSGAELKAEAAGRIDPENVSLTASASVEELNPLDERISGGLNLKAELSGPLTDPQINATLSSERLVMQGEAVEGLVAKAKGNAPDGRLSGTVALDARFRGQPLSASARLETLADGTRKLEEISVKAASTRLDGNLTLAANGRPSGSIDLTSPDLAEIAPLLLQEISGALTARVDIAQTSGEDVAHVRVQAQKLKSAGISIATADLDATVTDPLATPRIQGTLAARDIRQGAILVSNVSGRADHDGKVTEFSARAELSDGDLSLGGKLEPEGDGFSITLAKAGGKYKGLETRLSRQAKILIENGTAKLQDIALVLGSGSAEISGSAGEDLDVDVTLNAVPLSLANAFAPEAGLRGTLSGTAHAGGQAANPQARWSLAWANAGAAPIASFSLPAIQVKSDGQLQDNKVTHTTVTTIGGGAITAKGSANLAAKPIALDMRVNGTMPLAILQRRLIEAGLRMEGSAVLDMRIGGTVAAPDYGGTITGSGITAIGLDTGITVKSLAIDARFSPTELRLTSLSGDLGGGRISGQGTLGLGNGLPADFALKIDNATYQDGAIVKANLDADMTLSGPLAGSPDLRGSVTLNRTDITIPETIAGKISPLAVKHVNAPADIRQQTETLDKGDGGGTGGGDLRLDLTVNAPGQMFVRGRGLQAELAGTIRIKGTSGSPVTSGGFTLRRGTLVVLSRQLTFTNGEITFLGSFDPQLDFAATTTTSNAEVVVRVTGNASDPQIVFSSNPELPQDEVMAQLLFGQSLSNLSPAQIAQLASAVATLGGNDPLDRLRQTLGVDSINLTADEDNNAAVNIGKNLGNKLRLGVQQGTAASSSRVTIDLDINKTLRARGEVGEDGESKAGIYFEREY